ncbi:MAG: CDP-alcohol phosphatidyltransferase family protein [Prevotella sp.]|nr:CDP-alcohol phosphatidyltransferase family protein [Prevotella sp.]
MKKNIPNIITCCNLISGCIAVVCALSGSALMALCWIVIGAAFDFCDGLTARILGVSSPIGKELDSLADDITFGVAPSAMLFYELSVMDYPSMLEPIRDIIPYSAFIMAAFSALRLAKFNLDERQSVSFIGLPTPANALFWASLIVGSSRFLESSSHMSLVMIALMLCFCYLLVSEIPMFALKFKHWGWKGNEVKYIFIISSAILLVVFRIRGIALAIAWYIVLSSIMNCKKPGKQ